jgi:hypothetical protein
MGQRGEPENPALSRELRRGPAQWFDKFDSPPRYDRTDCESWRRLSRRRDDD